MKELLRRQCFFPTWVGLFLNPFYFARSGLARYISRYSIYINGKILDVGCGSKPYKRLFDFDEYIGLDIDSELSRKRATADQFYDGKRFPFNDNSFDSVICNQVLEHVFNPDEFLGEIHRVLKPGGYLLITVPFLWDEHEQPFDYARYSSFGLKALLEKNGFTVIAQEKIGTDASTIFQILNIYLYKIVVKWNRFLQVFFMAVVMSIINIMGLIARIFLPDNSDLFLDNLILVEKSK